MKKDKIYTALDYAKKRHGVDTVSKRLSSLQAKYRNQGFLLKIEDSDRPSGVPVKARIWQGAWIADCECGGAEFVAPEEPIFYCFGCANRSNGHKCRPVEFPENIEEIEAKILERPVTHTRGLDELALAEGAVATLVVDDKHLTRSWDPGETVNDLSLQQDKAIKAWDKKSKGKRDGVQ